MLEFSQEFENMEVYGVYKIGDYIVKPFNGVCKVEDILYLNAPEVDEKKLYYLLIPIDDKGEIYIPTDRADSNIRKVMTADEVWNLIARIADIEALWIDNEKFREKRYKEAVKSCVPEALIGIIKMTYLRKKKRLEDGKKSMAVDERYFKLAENNLYSEMGVVLNKTKDEVRKLIEETINNHK